MKIKIFTDLRFTRCATPTGVGKHIVQMARGLAGLDGNQVSVLAARDQADAEGRLPAANALSFLPSSRMALPWKLADAAWTLAGRPWADRWCGGADWVYCPKNDFIPLRRHRLAVTIHGAHELDPAMPPPASLRARAERVRRRMQYKAICGQARVILTVSAFLKAQIVEWFKADPRKITVVGNGVEPCYYAAAAAEPRAARLEPPYVLCVGGLNRLDGGDRALAVARELRKANPQVRLRVAGQMHERDLTAQARETGNVELLGYVPAESLAPLMRGALALLFLTRYETFGMAAAEAMASGTPVVTCRSTAVPEIVADAGLYVNPERPREAVDVLLELLADESRRQVLIGRGREHALRFTWDDCVQRLYHALEENL